MDTTSDSTTKATINNLFSSSNQVSFTKKNLPIIYILLQDFCKDNNIATGIKEEERLGIMQDDDALYCSVVRELTQMTGVEKDMDTEAEDKNKYDASGLTKITGITATQNTQGEIREENDMSAITGVSGIVHRNEEQETEDASAVTGMTELPVIPENTGHPPNKVTPNKLDFNGSLRNVPTKTRKDYHEPEEDHDNNGPDMDEHEEDQMAEELDKDSKSVMTAVT
eukprot:3751804-Ditylum_brightwellii.AAC.1